MDKFFGLSAHKTTVRTEIIAGITTFFALAYIVFVNPNQVAGGGVNGWLVGAGADPTEVGMVWNAVYIGSILAAVLGTILMSLYAKMPFAQACGMGLNAFFCTIFVSGAFFAGQNVIEGYQAGLVVIFISGLIFLILSITGAREVIAKAMPDALKKAIPAGIGLFIAFIGFQNAGIIQDNPYTLVQFTDFHGLSWAEEAPAFVAIVGFLVICVLVKLNVKGAVLIGIAVSTVLYYVFLQQAPVVDSAIIGQSFSDFASIGFLGLFNGAAWSNAFTSVYVGGVFSAIMIIISFTLVDMFDTMGTLYGTAAQADLLDENGDPHNLKKCMAADSIATVAGAAFGTSTCTTYVESASGVAAGGRTGLTSLVTTICLAACLFISPIASIVPTCATAPALIYVGVLMLGNITKIDFKDVRAVAPAFVALIMMPMTYSISNGIGLGAITYVVITIFSGKFTKKDIVVTVIAALFVLKFLTVSM